MFRSLLAYCDDTADNDINNQMPAKILLPPTVISIPIPMNLRRRRAATWLSSLLIAIVLLESTVWGQSAATSGLDPLPQDTGGSGLKQELRKLNTTGRLLQVVAHPDDEDGGMLTLEARGKGVSTTLMTLTRGEGGQNKVGSSLFDSLGVLRTLELTASDRYYGVEQRFSRVADFGFSKSPDETFQKWSGHDVALADIVRVVRTFHPDVLVARFSGTSRDGHGHHQASAILAKEAFRAAGDPNRFPEQIKEGLFPWQAQKLYIGNVCGFGANSCPDENWTVKLNTGQVDPLLGKSYIAFALDGLRHQLSQGAGGWTAEPGDRWTFYKLADSTFVSTQKTNEHEQDFFDGINTNLTGLAAGFPEAGRSSLFADLLRAQEDIKTASEQLQDNKPERPSFVLFRALLALRTAHHKVEAGALAPAAKSDLLARLKEKEEQAEKAFNLATGTSLEATAILPETANASENQAPNAVSPGQSFIIRAKLHNGSDFEQEISGVRLRGFEGWQTHIEKPKNRIPAGQDAYIDIQVRVPENASFGKPFFHRNDPERDSLYTIDNPRYQTLPLTPFPFVVEVHSPAFLAYTSKVAAEDTRSATKTNGSEDIDIAISAPVLVSPKSTGESKLPLAVVPVFSLALEPGTQVIPVQSGKATTVKVGVTCNLDKAPKGVLRLQVSNSGRVEPAELPVKLDKRGGQAHFEFKVFPASLNEGRSEIRAVLTASGKNYSEGYSLVTREDLGAAYYFQPAVQRASMVDVKVPKELKAAYIMGAGDDIPTVLQQIGTDLTVIPADKIASEDLGKYGTVVLGIRAYDTQKEIVSNNKKLLDYVSAGGTLVVQYNAGVSDFNSGNFTPYPMQIGRTRVSVEDAPLEILAADDGIFHYPNEISARDFDGWVQERGLNFADQWDGHFTPLLASHDPGESSQKGGLLRAQYGKGTYIFTGYAFFRQLPAGVPGATRLFVNLLSAGHEKGQ